nr:hypothetical protein [Escherichia coli]
MPDTKQPFLLPGILAGKVTGE